VLSRCRRGLAEAFQATQDASSARRGASLELLRRTHQLFQAIAHYLPNAEPWEHHLIGAAIAPRGFAPRGEILADGGTHTAEGILGEGVALPILGDGVDLPYGILADGGWVDFDGDQHRILADGGWVDLQGILADGGWVDYMKYLTAALEHEIQRLQEHAAPAPTIHGVTAEDDWETPVR
jgi:hypothetical protein